MKLFILRHGDAGERGDSRYSNDAARPLSSKGAKRTRQLANWLRRREITFDAIFTSPLTRAQQTAEIVARSLNLKDCLKPTKHLAPEGTFVDLLAQVDQARRKAKAVLLVGHEPYLSTLVSLLCTGGSSLQLNLKKGGLCRLELETVKPGRCATLEWLLGPRHFGPKRGRGRR